MARTLLPYVQHLVALIGRERVRGIVANQEMRSVALFRAEDWCHSRARLLCRAISTSRIL